MFSVRVSSFCNGQQKRPAKVFFMHTLCYRVSGELKEFLFERVVWFIGIKPLHSKAANGADIVQHADVSTDVSRELCF